ncbi:HD domain-containing protein [Caproiciproducens sp. LBM24188]|nr:HD domain-containing protein [Oscillospiraceae bacterium]HHV33007.1 HD domain-containing protein [Clostridiales bacterium]
MKESVNTMIRSMIRYNHGDPKRIHHALKVHSFAVSIGQREHLDEKQMEILELAAILHDIGIRSSEEKYGSSAGKYQELEGPQVAGRMLLEAGIPSEITKRVCFLIGHHHTYTDIDGIDYQILIEADFLVNLYEEELGQEQARTVMDKYFKTALGKEYLTAMYLENP